MNFQSDEAQKQLEQMLNSSNRDERIKARRRRIAQRVEEEKKRKETVEEGEEQPEQLGEGVKQVEQSLKRLSSLRQEGDSEVTEVKLKHDEREKRRRGEEEGRREELRRKMEEDAEKSEQEKEAITQRWRQLQSRQDASEISEELEEVKRACNEVVEAKDALIQEMKSELSAKEEEYNKALKTQAEEVDTLIEKMGRQYKQLESACYEELDQIEEAFLRQRKEIIDDNNLELENLFDKRHQEEYQFVESIIQKAEEYKDELEKLRAQDAEDYNILKIRLETDIQNLEQHLEAMRATYQLNTEKLEYNYKVLVERDQENKATIDQQKRKIAKQRDALSSLKRRHEDADKRFTEENQRMTEEYRRTTEQFKDLQTKLRHFKRADVQRYKDFWQMQEEHAVTLAKKLLDADRAITEQHLGYVWHSPSDDVFRSPAEEEQGLDLEAEPEEEEEPEDDEKRAAALLDDEAHQEIVQLLCDEAGFLIEERVKRACEDLDEDEQRRAQVTRILHALGVSSKAWQPLQEALAPNGQPVPAWNVVPTLRRFVESMGKGNAYSQNYDQNHGTDRSTTGPKAKRAQQRKEFWDRLASVVDDSSVRTWQSLLPALERYRQVLAERSEEVSKVEHLSKQNSELRNLLSNYLGSSVNSQLQVPPNELV